MVESLIAAFKVLLRRKISIPSEIPVLTRNLSVVDITCLGLSTLLGTGCYTLLAYSAKEKTGPSVVLSFLIAAVASCLGGLCFSKLSCRFPEGGPSYAYSYAALGELPSFLIGWSMILELAIGGALSAKSMTHYLGAIINFNLTSPFLFKSKPAIELNKGFNEITSIIVIITIGIILAKNLKITCLINNGLVFCCFLIISAIVVIFMFQMDADNWTTENLFFPNGVVGIFSAASTCFFAFQGYEIISSIAGECEHKIRTVPIGISLTFILGLVACFASSISITLLIPYSLFEEEASALKPFKIRHIDGIKYIVVIGAISGLLASLIVTEIGLSRLLQVMAKDGLLFGYFQQYNSQTGATPNATYTSCVLSAVIALCFETQTLILWLGMGTLISYLSAPLSLLSLRYGVSGCFPFELDELNSQDSLTNCTCQYEDESNKSQISSSISDYNLNGISKSYQLIENNDNFYNSSKRSSLMSVQVYKKSYVTLLTCSENEASPNHESARKMTGLIALMMLMMLSMAILTIHIPPLLSDNKEWWMEALGTGLFVTIVFLALIICRIPKHKDRSRSDLSCIPWLPLLAIWMDIYLIVYLPYYSWLVFFIWMLIGIFVYMSYGIWHSNEGLNFDNETTYHFDINANLGDKDEIIHCFDDITEGSSL